MSERPSSWRGIYVEYDPQGRFMMVWDGVGFLGTCQTQEALWEAVKRAYKGSPPCTTVFEAKKNSNMSEADRFAAIDAYLKANPNVKVPVRTELKINPTDSQIEKSVLSKKIAKMGDREREELLRQLMAMEKDDEQVQDIQSNNREDGSGSNGSG